MLRHAIDILSERVEVERSILVLDGDIRSALATRDMLTKSAKGNRPVLACCRPTRFDVKILAVSGAVYVSAWGPDGRFAQEWV